MCPYGDRAVNNCWGDACAEVVCCVAITGGERPIHDCDGGVGDAWLCGPVVVLGVLPGLERAGCVCVVWVRI